MWLEAIVSKEDLLTLLPSLLPLKFDLSDGGDIFLHDPSGITLVAGSGLRFTCKAKLHYPVLGLKVPVTVSSVSALVRPRIVKAEGGEQLVFGLEVEHVDFAGLPELLDTAITDKITAALRARPLELSWGFQSTLSHTFALPPSLAPLASIGLHAKWGEVRVTEEALVLAVAVQTEVVRGPEPAR
jgi:hypothetical protein